MSWQSHRTDIINHLLQIKELGLRKINDFPKAMGLRNDSQNWKPGLFLIQSLHCEGGTRIFICVLIQRLLDPCLLPWMYFLHSLYSGVRFLYHQLWTFSSKHCKSVFGRRHILRYQRGCLLTLSSTHVHLDLQKTPLFWTLSNYMHLSSLLK